MKVPLTRIFTLAYVLLCATCVRAQLPNPVRLPPASGGGVIGGSVITADFNGDGKADVLTPSGGVFLGNADGTLTPTATVSLGTTAQNCPKPTCVILFSVLAVGDFNGDGKPDILVQQAPTSSTGVSVFPGRGDGTFSSPINSNPGVSIGNIRLADVNGDGKLDLVFVSITHTTNQVYVSLGAGDGTFGTVTAYTVFSGGASVVEIVTGDFNGDGKIDVAASGNIDNAVGPIGVLFGNGDGTFATPAVTSVGVNAPNGLAVADFNGDGKLDLVLAGEQLSDHTQQTYFLPGKGDGTFQTPSIIAPGSGAVAVGDVNGDGKLDVVVSASPFFETLLGNGNGTFQQKAAYPSSNLGAFSVAIADFNGDGKLDISDGASVIYGKGDGTFQDVPGVIANVPAGLSQAFSTVATGDFNGDGKTDLAVGLSGVAPGLYILLGDGIGHHTIANVYTTSSSPANLQTADFNHDGKTDLVFNTLDSGTTVKIQTMLGHGDGSFAAPVATTLGPGDIAAPLPTIGLADFNGDGFPDLATIQNGGAVVLIGAGDGTFEAPVSYFAGQAPLSIGLGDFNADGKADIASCGSSGIGMLLGNGDGTFQPVTFQNPGPSPDAGPACPITITADFNNDGATDLMFGVSLWLSNGDGTFSSFGNPVGLAVNPKAAADLNDDGKLDLLMSDGVTTFLGNGDGTFSTAASQVVNFTPAWINPLIWVDSNDQTSHTTTNAVFAVDDFSGNGLPGIAMIVQNGIGGEISLPNPFPSPAPDFLISAGIPTVVAPGGQTTLIVTVKKIAGFSEAVTLSCGELPAGVTCTYPSAVINGGSGQTTVTITAASSSPTGTYAITFTGTATGAANEQSHNVQRAITIASVQGATNAHLAPLALNFGTQPVASSAAPVQTANLTNAGAAILQLSSVSISGTNAADFSVSSNGCGTSVAAFTSCPIAVSFLPTGGGSRSATLVVKDNATGGLQTVALAGSANDFTISTTSASSSTVPAGTNAMYSISVGGAGFTGQVNFTCSGAPTAATCEVIPTFVTLTGSGMATATVTVVTDPRTAVVMPIANRDDRWTPSNYLWPRIISVAVLAALLVGLVATDWFEMRRTMNWVAVAASAAILLVSMAMSGCGGGGGSSSGGSTPPPSGGTTMGTPAGTYALKVKATTGTGTSAVSHTTNLTLVVQ
jgi:hypothetical protein